MRDSIADPVGLFAAQVQQERLAAGVFLARPSAAGGGGAVGAGAEDQGGAVDAADGGRAGGGRRRSWRAVSHLGAAAAGGRTARRSEARVASKSVSKAAAEQAYTAVIVAGYRAIGASFLQMPDVHLVSQSSAVLRVAEAEDALLQAQALLAGGRRRRVVPGGRPGAVRDALDGGLSRACSARRCRTWIRCTQWPRCARVAGSTAGSDAECAGRPGDQRAAGPDRGLHRCVRTGGSVRDAGTGASRVLGRAATHGGAARIGWADQRAARRDRRGGTGGDHRLDRPVGVDRARASSARNSPRCAGTPLSWRAAGSGCRR